MSAKIETLSAQGSAALEHAADSFRVFPIPGARKAPPIAGWQNWATCDAEKIRQHWSVSPQDNIGIACGAGLLVLDVDGEAGAKSLAMLELIHGKLPETCVVSTPNGGRHYYFDGPDVANSAGTLGAKLDVRSAGGYVVAPCSVTDKGAYTVVNATEPAPAPQWLIDLCNKPRERQNTGEPVPDAPVEAVERARTWLEGQGGAIEGQGGDARTFVVAASLRDLGLSEGQTVDLLAEWNVKCAPPWSIDELRTKAENAFRYSENEAGARVALPEDFPVIIQEQANAAIERAAKPPQLVRMADLRADAVTAKPWLVDRFFQPGTLVCVFGEPGEGKSVLCGDLAHAVASGRPWLGQFKTQRGASLYVALEGYGSMQRRLLALRQQYGDAPVALATGRFSLATKEGREELAELVTAAIAAVGPLSLIVFDTWARVIALAGANENLASDVGRIADALELLAERTGAVVAVVHHSGKSAALGARGSNALLGAVQTEIEIADKSIRTRKQRDADEHPPVGFQLVPVTIGTDPAGEPVTAPLVQPDAHVIREKRLPPQAADALKALCDLSPSNAPVAEKDWQGAFERNAWPVDPPATATRSRAFRRAVKELNDRVVRLPDGQWARRCD